jgi:hypothetical protein
MLPRQAPLDLTPLDQHAWRRSVRDGRGHHPWRVLGEHFGQWRVRYVARSALPVGRLGWTRWDLGEIWVANGQNVADRRSTICHETGHLIRGPFPSWRKVYEEALVDRQAARLLLPSVRTIGHALAWAGADYEAAAEELWVDETMLNVRLSTLAPREATRLREQLATVMVDAPA